MRLLALVALAAVAFGQNNTDTAAAPASTAVAATGSVQPTGSAQPSAPASTTTPPADLANAVAPKTTSKRPFPTTSYPPPPPNPPAPPPLEQSSIWSYPLPPLPARTASAPNSAFTVTESIPPLFGGKTRKYTFNLGYSAGRPSGFKRRLATVNNQFPGPLIEAWQGDTVEVTVINNLDYPQVRAVCRAGLTFRVSTGTELCKKIRRGRTAFRASRSAPSSPATPTLIALNLSMRSERFGGTHTRGTVGTERSAQ